MSEITSWHGVLHVSGGYGIGGIGVANVSGERDPETEHPLRGPEEEQQPAQEEPKEEEEEKEEEK